MKEIPVYLFTGFLDSGKTTFLNGILEDGFARDTPTLLICCERGRRSMTPGSWIMSLWSRWTARRR